MASSDEGFVKMWEKEGITGCQRAGDDSGCVCVRGQGVITFKMLDIFAMAQRRVELEDNMSHFDVLDKVTSDTFFDRVRLKAIFPVTARESVNVTHFRLLPDGTLMCISFSHPDEYSMLPEQKGYVRANTNIVGYVLRPIAGGTHCTYILEVVGVNPIFFL